MNKRKKKERERERERGRIKMSVNHKGVAPLKHAMSHSAPTELFYVRIINVTFVHSSKQSTFYFLLS